MTIVNNGDFRLSGDVVFRDVTFVNCAFEGPANLTADNCYFEYCTFANLAMFGSQCMDHCTALGSFQLRGSEDYNVHGDTVQRYGTTN